MKFPYSWHLYFRLVSLMSIFFLQMQTSIASLQALRLSTQSVDRPALKHTRNTTVASSNWDMRCSTDAEFQNRIILHDTLNLPVVVR